MSALKKTKKKILFVDDEQNVLDGFHRQLRKGYNIVTAASGEEGLRRIAEEGPFAVIVSDMRMPVMDGIAFLQEARRVSPDSVRMMLTGSADQQSAIDAINEGAIFRLLTKPCALPDLTIALDAALEQHRLIMTDKEAREGDRQKSKETETALLESEARFRALFDAIEDFVYIKDRERRYVLTNDFFKKRFQVNRSRFLGRRDEESKFFQMRPEVAQKILETDLQVLAGETIHYELSYTIGGAPVVFSIYKNPLRDGRGDIIGICGVSRDITEIKKLEEEHRRSFEKLRKAVGGTVHAISLAVEAKDPYTAGHQRRVADLARAMATELALPQDTRDFIRIAASIHDIGKIAIPSEILSKPARLSSEEYRLVQLHSQYGFDILKDVEFPWPVAKVVLGHHERLDGTGYPEGLRGVEIPLEARIIAVADVVEAIASHRPQRPSLGIDAALAEIVKGRGTLYDPAVVDACLTVFREKGFKFS